MKLYNFQKRILDDTSDFNHVAYYLDMGLGKTFVGAEKAVQLGNKVNLLICQKSKIRDWMEHFKTNYPKQFHVLNLTKETGFMAFWEYQNLQSHLPIVGIINYELAWRRSELLELEDFTLILDESSLIQNRKAKQSKFIMKMKPQNVILLSGTPTSGRYENLWTQLKLLGWDIKESTYNTQYVNWKSMKIGWGVNAKIVPVIDKEQPYKNVERLKSKMREHGAVFLKTEEVLDLPKQIFTEIEVDNSKEYRKFDKSEIIEIDGETLVGDTELTKRLYQRQLCGIYSKEKLSAFRDLLQSTNERVVVFYNFTEEAKKLIKIATELEKPWCVIDGKNKSLAAYENHENAITFVQYQAGAMGLNLQKANIVIFFTLPDGRQDLFDQAIKRIHRIGQERSCFYYIMKCQNTVEDEILETLEMRQFYTNELFIERKE